MQSTVGWNYNNQSLEEAGIQIEDLYYFASFRKGLHCYAHILSKMFSFLQIITLLVTVLHIVWRIA